MPVLTAQRCDSVLAYVGASTQTESKVLMAAAAIATEWGATIVVVGGKLTSVSG